MDLIIYRNRKDNTISNVQEADFTRNGKAVLTGKISAFNSEGKETKAELIETNDLEEFLFRRWERSIKDFKNELQEIANAIGEVNFRIGWMRKELE